MSQPRHVFHLASRLSPDSLRVERGSSRFSSSEDCSGLNMVWMTKKSTFLAHSTQIGSSVVVVVIMVMSLINSYIESSFASVSTTSVPAWTIGSGSGWYSSSLIIFPWGDLEFYSIPLPVLEEIISQVDSRFIYCSVIRQCGCCSKS